MKHNRNLLSLTVAFLCFFTTASGDSLDKFIEETIQTRKIPGLSIAVIRDGKVIRANSYGLANLEFRTPASRNTVYEIGSISKQFASEAVMLLVEDGKLKLDDPVNKYLPPNAPEFWQKITIRNLLNHTSGLKDWTEVKGFSYRREYSPEEFIELVKIFPLQFQPNDTWLYSNTNLPLIGIIVERSSGQTFEDFVVERIIKPLGLPSIRFKHQVDVVGHRSSGYVLRDGDWRNGETFRPKVIAPSGGILANAVDLAKWWEAVLSGRVVKPASLDQMLMPAKINDGRSVNHGFAFFTNTFNGHKSIFHNGSTVGGFGSGVYHFPKEKLTIAVLGNLEDGGFGPEYISKRIANFYIPGASVVGLKDRIDATKTKNSLGILRSLAAGKSPEILSKNFAEKVPETFRKQLAANLKRMTSYTYLGNERIGKDHFILDPAAAEFSRFRMTLANKTVYYNFRINLDGKIGWIIFED